MPEPIDTTNEVWKPIPGYEGIYEASSMGRIRSLGRWAGRGGRRKAKGSVLAVFPKSAGYPRVNLCSPNGGRKSHLVHRVILATFVGPAPRGHEGCHKDGDRRNCVLGNLRWDTPFNNSQDKRRHGTLNIGTRNGSAKLTESDVMEIRRLRGVEGKKLASIAKRFGVARETVARAATGNNWGHLD